MCLFFLVYHEIMIAEPNKDPLTSHTESEERDPTNKANALVKEGIFFFSFLFLTYLKKYLLLISDTKSFIFFTRQCK